MTRHGCVAAALLCLLPLLLLSGCTLAAPLVVSSLTLESLRDATGAACVGSRLFVVSHTGVVNVLDASSAGELHSVAEVSLPDGDDTLLGATGIAAAPHPLGDSCWVWLTVGKSGSLVTLRVSDDGNADVVSTVSSPSLLGAAQVVVKDSVALVAAVASNLVVSVDVSDPALPAVVSTLRLSGVDALDWPEAGLVRVVSGSSRRLTMLSVTPRGGMAKHGSVKDVRLGAGGPSRARICTTRDADFSVVLSDVSGTTLALVNVTDRGVPAVVQGLSGGGAAAPDTTPLLFADTSSAWPSGYTSLRGASALACVNGTAVVAVPNDGDGTATGHLVTVQLASAFNAATEVLPHEALRGTSLLVATPWGVVAIAPAAGTVTSLAM
jgi:hypothetical protein